MTALHPAAPPPTAAEENVDVNPFAPLQHAQIAAPHRAHAVVDDRRWELGIKVDLPEFHGSLEDYCMKYIL